LRDFYQGQWTVGRNQGDRIGQIFAYWAIVHFGQFILKLHNYATFLDNFFHGT
jgi:hypothetical protein